MDLFKNFLINNVKWFSQGSLRFNFNNIILYIDPFDIDKNYNDADYIFISHPHFDHLSKIDISKVINDKTEFIIPESLERDLNKLGIEPKYKLKLNESKEFDQFKIKLVPAYNIIKTNCHPKEKNWAGCLIDFNNYNLYYTSDTELIPEMYDVNCNVIFLPLGQTYTFNSVDEAINAVVITDAEYAIPVHYGKYEGTLEDLDYFIKNKKNFEVIVL